MKKIAIFASGGGSNLREIYIQIQKGDIPAKIVLVVSNNPQCGALIFASEKGLENFIVNDTRFPNPDTRGKLLFQALLKAEVDLICLAGYMKLLPQNIVQQYKNKILNIHPALLPDFGGKGYYGMKVHEAVLKSGAEYSGATVHFVDEKYDHGPIIAQRKVKILDTDTVEALAERVLKVEHELYPEVVKASCENRIIMENNKPRILEYNEN